MLLLWADHAERRFAPENLDDLFGYQDGGLDLCLLCEPCDVRGQHHTVPTEERVVLRDRLLFQHVEHRTLDYLLIKGMGEVGFVHYPAAGRVDKPRRRLHLAKDR